MGNNTWLGHDGSSGEWCVAYHGVGRSKDSDTIKNIIGSIYSTSFLPGPNQVHANHEDMFHKGKKVGEGVYVTPYIQVAEEYAGTANVNGVNYKIVIMVRVNPSARRHCDRCDESRSYNFCNHIQVGLNYLPAKFLMRFQICQTNFECQFQLWNRFLVVHMLAEFLNEPYI